MRNYKDWIGILVGAVLALIFVVMPLCALSYHITQTNERLDALEKP